MEHIESTGGFAARLLGCRTLVLDEVDQLLETGFQRNIEFIISKLPPSTAPPGAVGRQTLAFSATVPARLLTTLKMALRDDHIVVDCVGEEDVDTHEKILQSVLVHTLDQSLLVLHHTLQTEMQARPDDYKIMCFLPTARSAQFLTAVLTEMGIDVMEIHSRKNQAQRTLVRTAR
jgi:ATP-dependent RNA helicase MSS116